MTDGTPKPSGSSASLTTASPTTPPTCPSCRSRETVTTSPTPDAASYWRCTTCGEVWNVARVEANGDRAPRWR